MFFKDLQQNEKERLDEDRSTSWESFFYAIEEGIYDNMDGLIMHPLVACWPWDRPRSVGWEGAV